MSLEKGLQTYIRINFLVIYVLICINKSFGQITKLFNSTVA